MDDRDNAGARPRDRPTPPPPRMTTGMGCPAAQDDFDADAEMARWVADIEAGRERIPEEWELDGSAVSLSLGDACDLDPALLAAMLGPDGLGGQSLSPAFGQDRAADALRARPGPGRPHRAGRRRSRGPIRRRADRRAARGPAAGGPGGVPADGVGRGVCPPPGGRVPGREGPRGPARPPPGRVRGRRTRERARLHRELRRVRLERDIALTSAFPRRWPGWPPGRSAGTAPTWSPRGP